MVDERIPLSKTMIDLRIKELELEEKARVISELKSKRDEASIKELTEKLSDDSWHLRELAVRALSELGRDVEQFVVAMVPGALWFTRACGAEVLGNIRSRSAINCLIDLLDDSNATVSENASKALLKICSGGDTVWVARAGVSRGEETLRKLQAVLEKFDKELAQNFLSLAKDVDLMKAPPEQVEKIAEEMMKSSEAQDLVWEELTGPRGKKTGRTSGEEGKDTSGTKEGGGEAGEQRSV
jgi:HEAT repeat protein